MPLKLTIADQARLLFKSRTEPRRNQKRFLRDLGGEGSAEELDAMLAIAENIQRLSRRPTPLKSRVTSQQNRSNEALTNEPLRSCAHQNADRCERAQSIGSRFPMRMAGLFVVRLSDWSKASRTREPREDCGLHWDISGKWCQTRILKNCLIAVDTFIRLDNITPTRRKVNRETIQRPGNAGGK